MPLSASNDDARNKRKQTSLTSFFTSSHRPSQRPRPVDSSVVDENDDDDEILLSELLNSSRSTGTTLNNSTSTTTSHPNHTKKRQSKSNRNRPTTQKPKHSHRGLENPWKSSKKNPAVEEDAMTVNNSIHNENDDGGMVHKQVRSSGSNNSDNERMEDANNVHSDPDSSDASREQQQQQHTVSNDDPNTALASAIVPLSSSLSSEDEPNALAAEPITTHKKLRCVDPFLFHHLSSKNILHQLSRRAFIGNHTLPHTGQQQSPLLSKPPHYMDTSSWLSLANPTNAGCRKVAWDYDRHPTTQARLGSLLACAFHDNWIRIYEVDTMNARAIRRRRQQPTTAVLVVEPFICFQTSLPALELQWNPYCVDELAIQTQQGVQLFDLAEVQAWQEERHSSHGTTASTSTATWQNNHRSNRPPCREYACKVRSSTCASFLFTTDTEHLLVATDDCVTCFHLYQNKPKWTLPWQRVSAMASIKNNNDLILLGSTDGMFCVININKFHRGSFSVGVRPTIVCEWSSYKGLNEHPGASWMGIQQLHAENVTLLSDRFLVGCLTWVTSGGAVLSATSLELPTTDRSFSAMNVLVHHAPKAIRCINADNEVVPLPRPTWSFPSSRCRSHCTNDMVIVEKVAQITRVLPQHDQRVMISTATADQRVVQDNSKPKLMAVWSNSGPQVKTRAIELRDRPLSLAIHPQHEWIAVGTNRYGPYLLHHGKK